MTLEQDAKKLKKSIENAEPKPEYYPRYSKKLNPTDVVVQEMLDRLSDWFNKMEDWGGKVRTDIVRLKARTGVEGDPGDPPPKPWG